MLLGCPNPGESGYAAGVNAGPKPTSYNAPELQRVLTKRALCAATFTITKQSGPDVANLGKK